MIAQINDRYVAPRGLDDPILVEATAAIFVSVFRERLDVRLSLPAADAQHVVELTASFLCQVRDHELLLARGFWRAEQVQATLARHLLDHSTRTLLGRCDVEDPRIIRLVLIHLQARETEALYVPGLVVTQCADPSTAIRLRHPATAAVDGAARCHCPAEAIA
ncbi:hypothetical protein ACWDRB_61070 [Nonomuraea sp. NPDC003707]